MNDRKKMFLISVVTALSSELYWSIYASDFRISTSVILLPVLLMTFGRNLSSMKTCTYTACTVLLIRLFFHADLSVLSDRLNHLMPNAVFYLCYGTLFSVLIPNKNTCSFRCLLPSVFLCDFLSNILELCITSRSAKNTFTFSEGCMLALIALFRTFAAGLFLAAESQYRTLLKREEHENRYRRLFLMTTGLKNEIYFMKKNSEEIESVMGNAYRLYETLSAMEVPEEMKRTALSIARDVHEVKKDYIRIIQGIEQEISEEYDEKRMSFQDLLKILEATTYHLLEEKNVRISLRFQCRDDFMTEAHYELMAVLKNIVNNAIESIEGGSRRGTIRIEEHFEDGMYQFTVSDDGPGISERHLPNIFKMGYSTKFDYKTGNIYRGIGLYGVKATVEEQFHGSIAVRSVPGKETVFTIRIPASSLEEV